MQRSEEYFRALVDENYSLPTEAHAEASNAVADSKVLSADGATVVAPGLNGGWKFEGVSS